jgi:hypothetical protein
VDRRRARRGEQSVPLEHRGETLSGHGLGRQLPATQHSYQKAIVGKRSSTNLSINDRYYIRIMRVPPSEGWNDEENRPLPTVPTMVDNWQRISTDAYASAPAVTVAAGWLVVLGRRSDNLLYLQMNQLNTANPEDPFDNADWGSAFAVPALPTGWTPQGDPAIANTTDFFGDITIATRARSGSQFRLFWMLYNGSSFGGWQQYSAVSGVVPSDPALAVHVDDFVTPLSVFFRGTDNPIHRAVDRRHPVSEVGTRSQDFRAGFPAAHTPAVPKVRNCGPSGSNAHR